MLVGVSGEAGFLRTITDFVRKKVWLFIKRRKRAGFRGGLVAPRNGEDKEIRKET